MLLWVVYFPILAAVALLGAGYGAGLPWAEQPGCTRYTRGVFKILFYTPEIPGNTGNAIRLAAITGAQLHLVEPLGFTFEDAWDALAPARVFAFTTTAATSYADIAYRPGDVFMFGPESVGLPEKVQQDEHITERVKIPMVPGRRSLNLANSASIAVFEGWRQHGFAGGKI